MSLLAALVVLSSVPALGLPAPTQGEAWAPGFFLGGLGGIGSALATFDDGSGPALYVGGRFAEVDELTANNIARWDGAHWETLAGGLTTTSPLAAQVLCMTVFDDGSGPELFVGGRFTRAGTVNANGIAKWNGTRWATLGSGAGSVGFEVRALTIFDEGSGPALYAGGVFTSIGGVAANSVARWDGVAWSALGAGIGGDSMSGPGEVEALAGFEGRLYAGGEFGKADGRPARNLAVWNGVKWRALGSGATRTFASTTSVDVLEVCTDSRGEFLAIGGGFNRLDGRLIVGLARFDGDEFEPIGGGLAHGSVLALAQYDDGEGLALYAGGSFLLPGGNTFVNCARWDGRAWTSVGDLRLESGTAALSEFEVFDGGAGKTLLAAGGFERSGARVVRSLAELRAGEWQAVRGHGQGIEVGINSGGAVPVSALEAFDDGAGEALYAAGNFSAAGTSDATSVARWDGAAWSPLGPGLDFGSVLTLGVFDAGNGPELHAGGNFGAFGAQGVAAIARWDGVAWWPLGGGLGSGSPGYGPEVRALTVFDDGAGPALFVGGVFGLAGSTTVHSLARWDGTSWSDVGGGVSASQVGVVYDMVVFDEGAGPALFVAGHFNAAGAVPVHSIARWDGASWSDVGGGLGSSAQVFALAVFDDGRGPALYAGGAFGTASAARLARWDGNAWSAVGSDLLRQVNALEVHDDGSGPALYVGGEFTRTSAGQNLLRIACWDGTVWSALGAGIDGNFAGVHALKSFRCDGIPTLFAGGRFLTAGGRRALHVACWSDGRRRRSR